MRNHDTQKITRVPVTLASAVKIIISTLFLLSLFIIIGYTAFNSLRIHEVNRDREEYSLQTTQLLNGAEHHIRSEFSFMYENLKLLRALLESQILPEQPLPDPAILSDIRRIDHISFYDPQGSVRWSIGPYSEENEGIHAPVSSDTAVPVDLFIAPVHFPEDGSSPLIELATPVRGQSGTLTGFLGIHYRADHLVEYFAETIRKKENRSEFFILDSQRRILSATGSEGADRLGSSPLPPSIAEGSFPAIAGADEGSYTLDETLYHYSRFLPLEGIIERQEGNDLPWLILSRIPLSSFETPLINSQGAGRIPFWLIFLLAILVSAGFSWYAELRRLFLRRIQEKNRSLEVVQKTAKLGFYELSVTHNRLEWSDEVYRIFGVDPDTFEATYEAFLSFVHPQDRERIDTAYLNALKARTNYQIRHRVLRSDGTIIHVNEHVNLEYDEQGNPLRAFGTVHDISDIVAFEEKLVNKNSLLEHVQALAHLGSWEYMIPTDTLRWSNEVYRIFGAEPQGFLATMDGFLGFVHPEDRAYVISVYTQSIEAHEGYRIRHRVLRMDGTIRWVEEIASHEYNEEGNPTRSIGTVHDITERVENEREIEHMKNQLESMVSRLPDIIYRSTITAERELLYINDASTVMTGYTPKELTRKIPLSSLIHPEDRIKVDEVLRESIEQSRLFNLEYRIRHRDGSTVYVQEIGQKVKSREGKDYLEGTITDVSLNKDMFGRMRKFLDLQDNLIIILDKNRIIFGNRKFLQFFGFEDLEAFHEKNISLCEQFIQDEATFHLGRAGLDKTNWIDALMSLNEESRIIRMRDCDNKESVFAININTYEASSYIFTFTDISRNHTEKLQFKYKATTDTLTGVYNREYFNEHIEKILERNRKNGFPTGIILFDIDRFKTTNDTYGHETGDTVLIEVSNSIASQLNREDILIRWGGDEFVIVTPQISRESLMTTAEELRKGLEQTSFSVEGTHTCSFGCTLHPEKQDIVKSLNKADRALYQAKSEGRNRSVFLQ